MTMLAVAIMVEGVDAALAQAALAAERGADMVEFRLDRFAEPPARAAELVERSPLPCIVTCRPEWEGGDYEGDEPSRLELLEAAAKGRPAYIDLEFAAWERDADLRRRVESLVRGPDDHESISPRLILSSHDFGGRPPDLLRRIRAMAEERACHVIKVAWRARSLRDNLEAFELISRRAKPTIAVCMGEFGLPSRVLAKKFNALLTFAGLDRESVTAPGQVGVDAMKRLYRWDAINAETAVYGVIGWPTAHSLSPHLHNTGFDSVGHNGVYLPLPIPPEYEHFKATLIAFLDDPHLHFRGASVTIPHKQNLLRFIAEYGGRVEPLAERIGAANTLTVGADGSLYASNTDYTAALDAVCHAMGVSREGLAGRRIAVIGAGGAARAIVAGFAQCGASVVVYNRTVEKAQELADRFAGEAGKVVAAPLDNLHEWCRPGRIVVVTCEIIINCTPIGMHPDIDATPIPDWPASFGPGTVVFDTIYNPVETELLRRARAAGCTTVSGVEMFVRQAAAQFEHWTGQPAPTALFDQIVRERLTAG